MPGQTKVVSDKELAVRAVARWVVEDHRPFSIVSTPGFRRMYRRLTRSDNPPPDRKTLRKRVQMMAAMVRIRLKEELKTLKVVAVTTDGWLSPTTQEFLCVVVHYFDKSWELKYRCIGVAELGGNSTAANVRAVIESILSPYGLRPSAVTCDQGINFAKAIDDMKVPRVICAAHNIHLCVMDMNKDAYTRFEAGIDQSADPNPFQRKCTRTCSGSSCSCVAFRTVPAAQYASTVRPCSGVAICEAVRYVIGEMQRNRLLFLALARESGRLEEGAGRVQTGGVRHRVAAHGVTAHLRVPNPLVVPV